MPPSPKKPTDLAHADVLEWQFDGWMSDWRPGERIAISRPKWPCGCSVFVAIVSIPAFGLLVNNLVGYGWPSVIVGGLLGGVFMFRWWHGPWSHIIMDFGADRLQVNSAFFRKRHVLSDVHRLRITTKKLDTAADTPDRFSASLMAMTNTESITLGTTYVEGTEAANAMTLVPMAAALATSLDVRFDVPDHIEAKILKQTEGELESLRVNDQSTQLSDSAQDDASIESQSVAGSTISDEESLKLIQDRDGNDEDDLDEEEKKTLVGDFGIDEWSPGVRVKTRTDGSSWKDLFGTIIISFVCSIVGVGILIYLYKSFIGELSDTLSSTIHLILANIISCYFVWRAYTPAVDVDIDWEKDSIEVLGGPEKHRTYSLDKVQELQLGGFATNKETMREQGRSWPFPPRWQASLDLVADDQPPIPLLSGTDHIGSLDENGDAVLEDTETAHLAYAELLAATITLATELDVPWRWIGFTGDDTFKPQDDDSYDDIEDEDLDDEEEESLEEDDEPSTENDE